MTDKVTLADCPPGLFEFEGSLGFKTEYRTNEGFVEAYCMDSGEFFWGGTETHVDRGHLLVRPAEVVGYRIETTHMTLDEAKASFPDGIGVPDQPHTVEAVAQYLVDQQDEPHPGPIMDRVNYWRDKALTAAERLRAIDEAHRYPTEDAYLRTCRALHWRTEEIRAMGGDPVAIPPDAPHYPPEGQFDGWAKAHEQEVVEGVIDRMGWPEIHAFYERIGQDVSEDAGGFILRKIKRLLGINRVTVQTYQDAIRAMITREQVEGMLEGKDKDGNSPEDPAFGSGLDARTFMDHIEETKP